MSALKFKVIGMLTRYNTLVEVPVSNSSWHFRCQISTAYCDAHWMETYKHIILLSFQLLICSPYFYPIRHHRWRRNDIVSDRIL